MKLYTCSYCNNLLYFENTVCLNCNHTVGFYPGTMSMISLSPLNNGSFADIQDKNVIYRFCKNAESGTCNWLVDPNNHSDYCVACELNRLIPDLSQNNNLRLWKNIEVAKHRLIYSLLRLNLPLAKKIGNEDPGIAFDFLADVSRDEKVMTGHDNGTITLNIDEADEASRVQHKMELGERYRTLLGHFRHEIGHYYWDLLIKNSPSLDGCRKLFGNDALDYSESLEKYYKNGAPANWMDNYISPYASSHAWEDWAETWAHYLHLMDTLETAYSFGVRIHPENDSNSKNTQLQIPQDPYETKDFGQIMKSWLPLTFAVNSLNRSMGYADFYPFIISDPVVKKLQFIHSLLMDQKVRSLQSVRESAFA